MFGGGVDRECEGVDHEVMERAGVTDLRNCVSIFVRHFVPLCARKHNAEGTNARASKLLL